MLTLGLVQLSGARWRWKRWREVHGCERGSVQSLSLVLTLPVFVLLVLFIVQVSQVMVAVTLVHYSAFAAARAASVWIPSDVSVLDATFVDDLSSYDPVNDQLQGPPERANIVVGSPQTLPNAVAGTYVMRDTLAPFSIKMQKIAQAAVQGCVPLAPSAEVQMVGGSQPQWLSQAIQTTTRLYRTLDPTSSGNSQIDHRLRNKFLYAYQNTNVILEWSEVPHSQRDVDVGPTYNPRYHPSMVVPAWNPNEIGFRDPVTVHVLHQFALMPGIGRVLSNYMVSQDRPIDHVSPRITRRQTVGGNEVYTIQLHASATFVNEGYKSVLRQVQNP